MSEQPRDLAELLMRLQRLEDAETARNHLHAYASTLDEPTPQAVAALFAEDAVLHVPGAEFRGREAIAQFYRSRFAVDPGDKRHFLMNVRTTHLGPGLVEIASYYLYTNRDKERSGLGWGTYLDHIQVTDGTALFTAKTMTPHLNTHLAKGWVAR